MFLDAVTEAFENLQTSVDNLGNGIISKSLFTLHQFLRIIIGFIDGLIYTIDAEIYDLMLKIADYSVFEAETINEISGRVYQLLALIMMFRLIFVFINYVVNPDQIVDKKKGLGNIAKKIIITLVLIIVTPWAFSESRKVQKIIFEDKAIEYFVFGQTMDENVTNGYSLMHGIGKMFVSPYKCYKTDDGWNCTPDKTIKKEICSNTWDTDGSLTVENGQYSATGGDDVCGYGASQDKEFAKTLSNSTTITAHKYDLMSFMQLAKYGNEDGRGWDSDFYVEYKYPLIGTTLIGIIIGYILVSMCIDIALRSVKLAFYEIISPIPIISNIGLKEGKDSMLGKWFNDVLKTYLDLFIRIIGLELAMFFINTLMKNGFNEVSSTGDFSEFFVKLFLVLGALLFAKKIPDILKSLGINLDTGGFSIKKKLEPATSMLRPLTGAAAGAVGGMLANAQASKYIGRNKFAGSMSALGGGITGAFRGAKAGIKQKNGLGIGAGFGAAGKSGQKIVKNDGTKMFERAVAGTQQRLGIDTEADRLKKKFDKRGEVTSAYDALKSYASGKQNKNPTATIHDVKYRDANGNEVTRDVNRAQASARLEALKSGTITGGMVRGVTYVDPKTGKQVTRDVNLDQIGASSDAARMSLATREANLASRRTQGYQGGAEMAAVQTDISTREANLAARRAQGYQGGAEIKAAETRFSQLQGAGFKESDTLTNDRATLAANREREKEMAVEIENRKNAFANRTFQESTELANERAALAEEKKNFKIDNSTEVSFTYKNAKTGENETRNTSLNELQSRLDTAVANDWSIEDQATLRNAIEANKVAQQQKFEESFIDRENDLNIRSAQEEVKFNADTARESLAIRELEGSAARAKMINDQKEESLRQQSEIERRKYDDDVEKARFEAEQARQTEAIARQQWQSQLDAEQRQIEADKAKAIQEEADRKQQWQAQLDAEEKQIKAEKDQQAEFDAMRAAALEAQRNQQQNEIIELTNQLAAADKMAATEFLNSDAAHDDGMVRAKVQAIRAALKNSGIDLKIDENDLAGSLKAISDEIEAKSYEETSDEYRRAQKVKEASKPGGSGK